MTARMMKALTFSSFGPPDVLEYTEVPVPDLAPQQVLVKAEAIGLNYADIYRRKGNYHLQGVPPFIAGYEGAGVVVAANTSEFKIGDRVAFADVPFANAELVAVPDDHVIPLPAHISTSQAASVLLQGLTAQYLMQDSYPVQAGDTVLVHAAAGGVGQLLTQMCKLKGATVIGLTRSADKLDSILSCKADYALTYGADWTDEVLALTDQSGVDVVYDSVGATLPESFEVTKPCGHVVFYGMSGGDPVPVDPRMLMDSSKTLTGGDLWSYLTTQEARQLRATQLFQWIEKGDIEVKAPVTFKLSEGKQAHAYLESGKSSGKVLLIPDE